MKLYISADMEGATGVTGTDDVMSDKPAYERFRKLLTKDVNAAIEGAIQGGADKIVVNEAHADKKNILIEELYEDAEMISGPTRFLGMMEGIDETFDAAFFIGYHSRAGTQAGVLNHTISGRQIYNIRLNGDLIGEFGLNALVAGHFGVPIVLVTGDDKVCKEAKDFLGNLETVQVKVGIDRFVAKCLPPIKTSKMITESARKALENLSNFKPIKVDGPIKIEIEFMTTAMAASLTMLPNVTREGPREISFTSGNMVEANKLIMASIYLANRATQA